MTRQQHNMLSVPVASVGQHRTMTTDPIVEVPARMPSVPAPMLLRAAALIVAALVGVVCASAWPTVAVALAVLLWWSSRWRGALRRSPSCRDTGQRCGWVLKARLSAERAPSPNTLGASCRNILLLIGFVSWWHLTVADRYARSGAPALSREIGQALSSWRRWRSPSCRFPSGHLAQGIRAFA